MYEIYHNMCLSGLNGKVYKCIYRNDNILSIKDEIKRRVLDGTPLRELKIVEEIGFEFKSAVVTDRDTKQNNQLA